MPEFLRLLPPDEARELLLSRLKRPALGSESLATEISLDRVVAADIVAPHPLPEFKRSTVDGYALLAADTHGASDSLPAYMILHGEVPMGGSAGTRVLTGQCALIHTGGMIPEGADAVVMLEHTQVARRTSQEAGDAEPPVAAEIEVLRPVAAGENVIGIGEDVRTGQVVIPRGTRLRPVEIGGLMALGLTKVTVVRKPRVAIISSGDEVVSPEQRPGPGQVRDVNAYTLAAAVTGWGGVPAFYGIIPDQPALLEQAATKGLSEADCLIISAGSSASARDRTAEVINRLGVPGVIVHGVNTRPGKPTILGVCDGKPVLGLPGNPVSALVNAYLFVLPILNSLLGLPTGRPQSSARARLMVNLQSEAGREDWWPVRLRAAESAEAHLTPSSPGVRWLAEPIFGRSNLIFTLVAADGLIRIAAELTGLAAGSEVDVLLL